MTTTPSPEQFLAQPHDPEDDLEPAEPVPPLESIAESLRDLVALAHLGQQAAPSPAGFEAQQLLEDLDDLEAKHGVLLELVEEIEGIVKPSTSKVSLEVKAAIGRWANPEAPAAVAAPEEPVEEPEPEPADMPTPLPAPQTVEEWRAYAVGFGHDEATVSGMNRSQIRTLLGFEQPVEG